jgi:hypothetical protein
MGVLQPEKFPFYLRGYFDFFSCNVNKLFQLLKSKSQALYLDNNFNTIRVPVRSVHTYSDALRKLHAEFYHRLQEFQKVERSIDL